MSTKCEPDTAPNLSKAAKNSSWPVGTAGVGRNARIEKPTTSPLYSCWSRIASETRPPPRPRHFHFCTTTCWGGGGGGGGTQAEGQPLPPPPTPRTRGEGADRACWPVNIEQEDPRQAVGAASIRSSCRKRLNSGTSQ